MRWTAGIMVAVATVGLAAASEQPAAAVKLDGTYELVELLIEGKPNPKASEVKTIEIKDGVLTIKLGEREEGAKIKFDPSKKPAEIDLTPTRGKEEAVFGIYELKATDKGTELTMAFTRNGGPRPKDFKGEGKDEMVFKLFRKK